MYVCASTYLPSYSLSASISRQSAPSETAAAPTCASRIGCNPYTYCHAQTRKPSECSADTS